MLDLCPVFAGNFANLILVDLGAQVIKVESTQYWQYGARGAIARPTKEYVRRIGGGWGAYPDRDPGARPWDRYGGFHTLSRGKLSMTVDLRRPEGIEAFKRLAKVSDIVIESNSPPLMAKLGLDYPQLKEVKPDVIMVRMPGYGLSGPYRDRPAMAPTIESFTGHSLLKGYPDVDASAVPTGITSDGVAGAGGAVAALMALFYRDRTGLGQLVEVAQVENFMPLLGQFYMDYVLNQRVSAATGNRHPSAAPCGCYPCAGQDRWVNITVQNDEQWEGLRRALGDPEWARDPVLATIVGRYRRQDELDEHISGWTRSHTNYEVMETLQRQGVPAGPVLGPADTYKDPHLLARGHFQEVTSPAVGTYLAPGVPWKMSRTPRRIERPAPMLGQHNEYVYRELLGYSDEEYARLEAEGHIGTEPAQHIP